MTSATPLLPGLDIRPAHYSDLPDVLEMWMTLQRLTDSYPPHAFGEPDYDAMQTKLSQTLNNCMESDIALILVATLNEQTIGTLSCFLGDRQGYERERSALLISVWLAPEYRRFGIASQMLNIASSWAKTQGAYSIQVSWHPGNPSADAFWRSHGFESYEVMGARRL